jgi:integrase/recombinase XerD
VLPLDPEAAVFAAMLSGWADQQRARVCKSPTVQARASVVRRFADWRQEVVGLDLVDLRSNPKLPSYGRFGGLFVRFGKAPRGSSPKRRTVLTVPELDWIVEVLKSYLEEVRPCFRPGRHPALWVTERCGRLSKRGANEAFTAARDAAGLPQELDLHSLRHSYVTHLTEFDYPERFVQDQVGHSYASTTSIYSHVSDEYRNRLLREALTKRGIAVGEDQ